MALGDLDGIANVAFSQPETVTWETASDWDNGVSESGVVHEGFGDLPGGDTIVLGYPSSDGGGSALDFYFPHHEDGGSTLDDVAGGNDGSISGNANVGQPGLWNTTAHEFNQDGENTYPGTYGLSGSSPWSVSLWYYPTGTPASYNWFLWHPRREYDVSISHDNEKFPNEIIFNSYSGGSNYMSSGVSPSENQWYNIVVVFDDSTGNYRIHINGTEENSKSLPDPGSVSDDNSLMGRDFGNGLQNLTSGRIAAVRQWDRALSTSEANGLHDDPLNGSLTTATKSFSRTATPDLQSLQYSLNGESITVDVTGSPGTASEETNTVTLDGASSYTITWAAAHTEFRLTVQPATSDVQTSPTFSRGELYG